MSRKTHPIGFRLGLAQPWLFSEALYATFQELLRQYVLYSWFLNFAQQNSFYFLRFRYLATKFYADFLHLVVFFPFKQRPLFRKLNYVSFHSDLLLFRKRRSKKKKKVFVARKSIISRLVPFFALRFLLTQKVLSRGTSPRYLRRELTHRGLFARNVYLKRKKFLHPFWASLYLNWHTLRWTKRRTKMKRISHVFSAFSFIKIRRYKKIKTLKISRRKRWQRKGGHLRGVRPSYSNVIRRQRFRKSRLLKQKYLQFLLYRFFCLRFRRFLEQHLVQIHPKPLNIILYNVTDIFRFGIFSKFRRNRKLGLRVMAASLFLTHRFSEYKKYNFLGVLVGLVVTSSLMRAPHALLQWVWTYSIKIRKHSRYLTHRQLFNIVYRTVENTILLVGTFQGARVEIAGKLNDSTRTRRQITLFGKTFKRQTIFTNFVYSIKQIPTYLGVLGFRLWYIY